MRPVSYFHILTLLRGGNLGMNEERATSLWQAALAELKGQVSRANFETWLRDTVALSFDDGCLTVGAPTGLATDWLQERMGSVVHTTLAKLAGRALEGSFALFGGWR